VLASPGLCGLGLGFGFSFFAAAAAERDGRGRRVDNGVGVGVPVADGLLVLPMAAVAGSEAVEFGEETADRREWGGLWGACAFGGLLRFGCLSHRSRFKEC
jgi:hypothetical protein